MELTTRNVNTAFRQLVTLFERGQRWARGEVYVTDEKGQIAYARIVRRRYSNPNGSGETLRINGPATIIYERPTERVLFNPARDANPFFHLYESLWMLAGRNDIAPLRYYVPSFDFTDDGKTVPGAYGYRWRKSYAYDDDRNYHSVDQLDHLLDYLRRNPNGRRAVLSMWNVEDDLLNVEESRDVCCNLNAMFSIREEVVETYMDHGSDVEVKDKYLDMTVTNRSNDLILGTLGANAVHFSFLQEYLADCLGVSVGRYVQFSNDLHVYVPSENSTGRTYKWTPKEWLDEYLDAHATNYGDGIEAKIPLVKDRGRFDAEVQSLVRAFSGERQSWSNVADYIETLTEPFLVTVAAPMLAAFAMYKERKKSQALDITSSIMASDWRIAATSWLSRRKDK